MGKRPSPPSSSSREGEAKGSPSSPSKNAAPAPIATLLVRDGGERRRVAPSSSPTTRLNENLIKRVANTLTFNERAKYEIVAQSAGSFYEILLIKLRQTILADRERVAQLNKTIEERRSAETSSLLGALSPRTLLGPASPAVAALGSAAAVSLAAALSQTSATLYQQLGARALVVFVALEKLKATLEVARLVRERDTLANLVNEFTGGGGSYAAVTEEERLERNVKLVCEVIVRRHIEQIVPLSRASHRVLVELMVRRIRDHFQRSPRGYADESRAPLLSTVQLAMWAAREQYRALVVPADRRALPPPRVLPSQPRHDSGRGDNGGSSSHPVSPGWRRTERHHPLSLPERAIRALTFEHRPEDDFLRLDFEPFFTSPSDVPWTAGGLLSRCGLRVTDAQSSREEEEEAGAEECFALHPNDAAVYGFANATLEEVERRGMRPLVPPLAMGRSFSGSLRSRM